MAKYYWNPFKVYGVNIKDAVEKYAAKPGVTLISQPEELAKLGSGDTLIIDGNAYTDDATMCNKLGHEDGVNLETISMGEIGSSLNKFVTDKAIKLRIRLLCCEGGLPNHQASKLASFLGILQYKSISVGGYTVKIHQQEGNRAILELEAQELAKDATVVAKLAKAEPFLKQLGQTAEEFQSQMAENPGELMLPPIENWTDSGFVKWYGDKGQLVGKH